MARILVIEDEPILRRNVVDRLRAEGHELFDTPSGETGAELCTLLAPDLVLTDLRLPGIDGLNVLAQCRRVSPRTLVVLMTAHGTQQTAVEAIRTGAYDYLNKPVELKELVLLVERAMSHSRALDAVRYAREAVRGQGTLDQIVGVSPNTQGVKQRIVDLVGAMRNRNIDPVLITGEPGTGKDLVAHVIHNEGPRKDGPFIHAKCTGIPGQLVESMLFGFVERLSSQQRDSGKGLFETAEGGTIYLDEIEHLSASVQGELSRVLETNRIRPVGAKNERPVDVHIIASSALRMNSNVDATDPLKPGLYDCLRSDAIRLLALRERRSDVRPLAGMFINRFVRRFKRGPVELADEAGAALEAYEWPGNVRELSQVIESAVLVCDGEEILPRHLQLGPRREDTRLRIRLGDSQSIDLDPHQRLPSLGEINRRIIQWAYEHLDQDVNRTAEALKISSEEVRRVQNRLSERTIAGS
jgi:DNA-binding NtrC family response regulator